MRGLILSVVTLPDSKSKIWIKPLHSTPYFQLGYDPAINGHHAVECNPIRTLDKSEQLEKIFMGRHLTHNFSVLIPSIYRVRHR